MKNLIAANWKMNPVSKKEAKELFNKVKKIKSKKSEVVVCPPNVYLESLGDVRHPTKGGMSDILLGAQNCFYEEKGAFTGEISAAMLKDLGVEYVILGHSERRKYFLETDEIINKKIKKVLQAKLKPIFCIGETAEEKQQEKRREVLEKQITDGLKSITREEFKNIAIAYEPVWAIGTGNNCSASETQGAILLIRKIISLLYNRQIADNTRIIYGGSVKSDNSASYIKEAGANGLLVGGASLNGEEFAKIIKNAE